MAMLHQILGLASILFILESSLFLSGRASPPESPLKRQTREVGAPHPIDCELTAWGNWSKCEPCTSLRYRSRDIVKMGQFGGKRCLAPVGDSQRCKPDKPCEIENDECKPGEFKCDSGRCIKNRLVCNADNDCGDNSDELCDDQDPKPTCRTHDLELSEIGRTAGNGVNILGLGTRSNPFDNEYFNGICDRVRDGNKAMYFRKPWNAATLVYQTRADRSFTTETFENSMDLISKHIEETTNTFGGSLTLKVTPTEHNDTTIGGTLELNNKKSKRLEKIKEYSTQENKMFIKLSGTVELGTFHLRGRGAMLTNTFIEDMTSLPTVYDKGEYFQFLETYGTHYSLSGTMGGKYELVYIVDTQKMKLKEVTSEDVSDCLGFSLSLSLTKKEIEAEAKIKNEKCSKIIDNDDGTQQKNDVIDKVISFVEGGTVEYATELDEKLSKRIKEVDTEDFVKWATSLTESPVLIKQKPSPIYTLIPVDAKDAHEKKQNLERAIEDYLNENSVCKCQPCQNGGTVMLVDGECLCQCTIYFKGIACQIKKSTMYENPPVVVDGRWGCWSPASSCVNEEQTLQRQCNNPAPGQGGKPCPGENIKKVPC